VSTDCTYSYTVVAGQDGPAAVAVSGADLAGNSATASHSFIVDTLPATISGAAAPPPNANGWNNTAVTVTFSCADAGVGIKSSPNGCRASAASGSGVDGSTTATWTLSAETPLAGISVVGTAEDNAGNTATATVGPIRIDLTPPTISASVAPAAPDGANGWYVSDVTATFDCADALSDMAPGGCASTGGTTDTGGTTSATSTLSVDSVAVAITSTATDAAGNTASASAGPFKLDKTRPTSRVLRVGSTTPGHGAGFNASTLGSLTSISGDVTDSASGPASLTVTLQRASDGLYWNPAASAWQSGTSSIAASLSGGLGSATRTWTTTDPLPSGTGAANGWLETTYTLHSQSVDNAGNQEAAGGAPALDTNVISFGVDANAPNSASIAVCQLAPCGTSDMYVTNPSVHLHLHAEDSAAVTVYALGQSTLNAADAQSVATAAQAGGVSVGPVAIYDNTGIVFTLAGADGVHYVAAEYRDGSGNWCCAGLGAPAVNQADVTTAVTLDTVAPSLSVESVSPNPAGVTTVTIVARASDATSGIGTAPSVNVTQAGGCAVAATLVGCSPALPQVGASTDCTYTYNVVTGQDGPALVSASVADRAGLSSSASASFAVDTAIPVVSVTIPTTLQYKRPGDSLVVSFTYTEGNPSQYVVELRPAGGGAAVASTLVTSGLSGPSGTRTSTLSLAGVPDGLYDVVVGLTDSAGQTGSDTRASVVHVDGSLPVSAITSPANGAALPTLTGISGTANDPGGATATGLASVGVSLHANDGPFSSKYWNGSAWAVAATFLATDNAPVWTLAASLPTGASLPEGSYTVCSRAIDGASNTQAPLSCNTFTIENPPYVHAAAPDGMAKVSRTRDVVTVTFSEAMFSDTAGTVPLSAADYGTRIRVESGSAGGALVAGTGSYNATTFTYTVTLTPDGTGATLAENTLYVVNILGGPPGVRDSRGNVLADGAGAAIPRDVSHTFNTPNPTIAPWTPPSGAGVRAPSASSRRDVAASAIGGQFYVVGGQVPGGTTATAANESYDPMTDTWTSRAPMPTARYGLAAAVYADKLYVFGGANTAGTLKTVEAFNPATNTWSTETPLPTALKYLAAAEMNGLLYVVGGTNVSNAQQSALYAYDPIAKTWTTRAPMPAAGAYPTGARNKLTLTTANGRLWAIGGAGGQGTHVQLYNPAANTWTEAPNLPAKRSLHGTSVLNGYLYVVGGLDATTAQPTDTVYVYDPLLGTGGSWRTATPLPEARAAFGGQVAVVDTLPEPARSGILVAAGAVGATSTVTNSLTVGSN